MTRPADLLGALVSLSPFDAKRLIDEALAKTGGNATHAARELGVSLRALNGWRRRLKDLSEAKQERKKK